MRHLGRLRGVRLVLAAVWAGAGCRTLVDPPLPVGTTRLTPPAVYARWWAMTEACSGLSRDFGAVTWYVVPGAATFPSSGGAEANGYYSHPGNEIVLAGQAQLDATVVRHEILHALLRDQPGHPRAYFLERCAGEVVCADACVADAGPAPTPPADTREILPSALRVGAELSPAAPSASSDGGWFTLTVTATNSATTPVAIASTLGSYDARFAYALTATPPTPAVGTGADPTRFETAPAYDASARQFAAGETKRYVFDFHVGDGRGLGDRGLAAGHYTFRGAFATTDVRGWSAPIAASLSR